MTTPRGDILREAASLTETDRNRTHGDAVEQQRLAGELYSLWHLQARVARIDRTDPSKYHAHDAAIFLLFVKLSRIACGTPNRDNYVDGAAYLAIAGESEGL